MYRKLSNLNLLNIPIGILHPRRSNSNLNKKKTKERNEEKEKKNFVKTFPSSEETKNGASFYFTQVLVKFLSKSEGIF